MEEVQNIERPLGLDKIASVPESSSEYVLETCGAGRSSPAFRLLILQNQPCRGFGLDSWVSPAQI